MLEKRLGVSSVDYPERLFEDMKDLLIQGSTVDYLLDGIDAAGILIWRCKTQRESTGMVLGSYFRTPYTCIRQCIAT